MRLIGSHPDRKQLQEFSFFLQSEGIHNRLEWDDSTSRSEGLLWIVDEDDLPQAQEWWLGFSQDPTNPMFYGHLKEARQLELQEREARGSDQLKEVKMRAPRAYPQASDTLVTLLTLFLCSLLFAFGKFGADSSTGSQEQPMDLVLRQTLLFDYSSQQQLLDQIQSTYGREALLQPDKLPVAGRALYQQAVETPAWHGIYPYLLPRNLDVPVLEAPLFERILQGQIWRLFTPCLLHLDFFHIFFNMLWLLILGSQIETRIGGGRYLLFILVAGVFSNLAQYLMSGPNFLGISGVVCAMAVFIWVRHQKAPWEGYNLPTVTFLFLLFFILTMLIMQFLSFLMEASGGMTLTPGIANTAHISGGLLGAFLAQLKFFEWRQ